MNLYGCLTLGLKYEKRIHHTEDSVENYSAERQKITIMFMPTLTWADIWNRHTVIFWVTSLGSEVGRV